MFRFIIGIAYFVLSANAGGEFSVLHSPDSVSFKGHDHIRESTLNEVYSAALGFSTQQYSRWEGLYINDPFSLAEAVVGVMVDGVSDIGLVKGHHFPLRTDEDEAYIYNSLEKRILERYPEQTSNDVRIDLSNGLSDIQKYDIFHSIKNDKPTKSIHSFLKNNVDEDREFLKEISLLNALIDKIEKGVIKRDYVPDIYWFKLNSLHPLQDLYGENSTTVKEAKQILNEALVRLTEAFVKVYNGNVLVTVITSDASHTRRSRSILQAKVGADDEKNDNSHNLAKNYSRNYPVIFNIILWFGVVMVFALLAISLAIGNMDPGRDSIIYRMTSTRIKKDN